MFGTFDKMEFGWAEKTIYDLSGAPYEGLAVRNEDQIYNFMKNRKNKYSIICCYPDRDSKGRMKT